MPPTARGWNIYKAMYFILPVHILHKTKTARQLKQNLNVRTEAQWKVNYGQHVNMSYHETAFQ